VTTSARDQLDHVTRVAKTADQSADVGLRSVTAFDGLVVDDQDSHG
jgi:hypothetical protein